MLGHRLSLMEHHIILAHGLASRGMLFAWWMFVAACVVALLIFFRSLDKFVKKDFKAGSYYLVLAILTPVLTVGIMLACHQTHAPIIKTPNKVVNNELFLMSSATVGPTFTEDLI